MNVGVVSQKARQQLILKAIKEYIRYHKYPPSHRDLAELTGIPKSSVNVVLLQLERDKRIDVQRNKSRCLKIVR